VGAASKADGNTRTRETVSREAILQRSARLFASRGYRGTNLQLVAEQLGVTRQALYYHFQNKGDILGALFDVVMSKMETAVDAAPSEPGEPRFLPMVRAHIQVIVDNADQVALLIHERPELAKLAGVDAHGRRQAYTGRFMEAYRQGVADGFLVPMDSRLAVNMVLAATNAISAWYHNESKLDPADVAANVEHLVFRGVVLPKRERGR
jgi:TetR/AcrR family transcriptional regulator, cholesterol catabolism regulator